MSPPWTEILESFRRGEPSQGVVDAVLSRVREFARWTSRDPEIVADASADVVMQLLRYAHRLDDPERIEGWLRVVTCNAVYRAHRLRERQRGGLVLLPETPVVPAPGTPRPIDQSAANEVREHIDHVVSAWIEREDPALRRDLLRAVARPELTLDADPPSGLGPPDSAGRRAHRKALRHLHDALRVELSKLGSGEIRPWRHLRAKDDEYHATQIQTWLGSLPRGRLEVLLPRGTCSRRRARLRLSTDALLEVVVVNSTPGGGFGVIFPGDERPPSPAKLPDRRAELLFDDDPAGAPVPCVIERFGPVSFEPHPGARREVRDGLGLAPRGDRAPTREREA
ncbi:MAG: sigma-70 family RNA polymerase sigma factor [Planctomycetes bacterium]|nr:sigma-70 family RNA polymerase sigma factor [Planctomycetota bacterium]